MISTIPKCEVYLSSHYDASGVIPIMSVAICFVEYWQAIYPQLEQLLESTDPCSGMDVTLSLEKTSTMRTLALEVKISPLVSLESDPKYLYLCLVILWVSFTIF